MNRNALCYVLFLSKVFEELLYYRNRPLGKQGYDGVFFIYRIYEIVVRRFMIEQGLSGTAMWVDWNGCWVFAPGEGLRTEAA